MNPWQRRGWFYYATLTVIRGGYTWNVTKKLDFISYNVIKWIHGEEKLSDMAMKTVRNDLFKENR
jgi:hypothetical protein